MIDVDVKIKDEILETALPLISLNGWKREIMWRAADQLGYAREAVKEAFPAGIWDLLRHFSDWTDRQMLDNLPKKPEDGSRVRDRIKTAVMVRFNILSPYKGAVQKSRIFWMASLRSVDSSKALWRTADKIWLWAGDTSQDYNRYTKRALLSVVIAATMPAWFHDQTEDLSFTRACLDKRIESLFRKVRHVMFYKKRSA